MRPRRTATWPREYARNRARVLAVSNVCVLCGHGGAKTADHIVSWKHWPKDSDGRLLPGFNSMGNLQPAHGTMGSGPDREHNRCPVCSKLCNQSKGAGSARNALGRRGKGRLDHFPEAAGRPASRDWGLS